MFEFSSTAPRENTAEIAQNRRQRQTTVARTRRTGHTTTRAAATKAPTTDAPPHGRRGGAQRSAGDGDPTVHECRPATCAHVRSTRPPHDTHAAARLAARGARIGGGVKRAGAHRRAEVRWVRWGRRRSAHKRNAALVQARRTSPARPHAPPPPQLTAKTRCPARRRCVCTKIPGGERCAGPQERSVFACAPLVCVRDLCVTQARHRCRPAQALCPAAKRVIRKPVTRGGGVGRRRASWR